MVFLLRWCFSSLPTFFSASSGASALAAYARLRSIHWKRHVVFHESLSARRVSMEQFALRRTRLTATLCIKHPSHMMQVLSTQTLSTCRTKHLPHTAPSVMLAVSLVECQRHTM